MGIFKKQKTKREPETINISADQLYSLLEKAAQVAAEEVNTISYILGPEIMFEYKDDLHFIGIRYDRKRAKKEGKVKFDKELMTAYIDNAPFQTTEELYNNAVIGGNKFHEIQTGIIVGSEYKELLDQGE